MTQTNFQLSIVLPWLKTIACKVIESDVDHDYLNLLAVPIDEIEINHYVQKPKSKGSRADVNTFKARGERIPATF